MTTKQTCAAENNGKNLTHRRERKKISLDEQISK
jgi:hypothetical protein